MVEMKRRESISRTSDYLVIHLRRFEQTHSSYYPYSGMNLKKNGEFVDFPMEGLDISKYVDSFDSSKGSLTYDLYGVIHHSGGLGGGHYYATCKNFRDHKWYFLNDSSVKEAYESEIVRSSAYALFYKRSQPTNEEESTSMSDS